MPRRRHRSLSICQPPADTAILDHGHAVRARRAYVPNPGQRELYGTSGPHRRRNDHQRAAEYEEPRRRSDAHALGMRRSAWYENELIVLERVVAGVPARPRTVS